MQPPKFDPIDFASRLEKAGVPREHADLHAQEVVGIHYDILVMEEQFRTEIAALRDEFAKLRADIDKRFAEIDKRFAQIDTRFAEVDVKFEQMKVDLIKWMVALSLAQTGTIVAVLKLLP